MSAVLGDQLWWYVARSGGLVALALSAASVLWGLLLSSRYLQGRPRPAGLLHLHKFLGVLTVIFSIIHVGALYLDSFVQFSIADLLVPFWSEWKPAPVAWGVIAFWILVAVQLSSMVMHRIPRRLWKWIHLCSYALVPLGLLHGITSGSDASARPFQFAVGGVVGLLSFMTAWRAIKVPGRRAPAMRRA